MLVAVGWSFFSFDFNKLWVFERKDFTEDLSQVRCFDVICRSLDGSKSIDSGG